MFVPKRDFHHDDAYLRLAAYTDLTDEQIIAALTQLDLIDRLLFSDSDKYIDKEVHDKAVADAWQEGYDEGAYVTERESKDNLSDAYDEGFKDGKEEGLQDSEQRYANGFDDGYTQGQAEPPYA